MAILDQCFQKNAFSALGATTGAFGLRRLALGRNTGCTISDHQEAADHDQADDDGQQAPALTRISSLRMFWSVFDADQAGRTGRRR